MLSKSLKLTRYFILGGVFLTPFLVLIVADFLFFPFITGKNFTFRILVEIIFALWLILTIFDKNYRPHFNWPGRRKNWLLIIFSVFILILILSTFLGVNSYRSFWSNYERMEGLITYLHLFALFLVLISIMDSERLWRRLLNTSLGVSVLVAIYGFFQLAGKLAIHQGGVRLDATLGNASYLAIYMAIHVFLALMFLFITKKWWQWFYFPIAVLDLIILYYTATRGALLGLVGGFILGLILLTFFHPAKKIKLVSASLLGLLIILIVSFFFIKNSDFIRQSSVLSRFSEISFQETTTQSRLIIWKMAWQGFKERPILGWGLENFNLIFNKYYEPALWRQEPWFDRAHNVFLDRLTANGSLGLLAYLGLFISALYYLWLPFKKNNFSTTESAVLTSMLAVYFFHNIFVFDNLISSLLFITILAYISGKSSKRQTPLPEKKIVPSLSGLGVKSSYALIIGVVTIFIVYYLNIPAILAGSDLIKALSVSGQGDFQSSLSEFQKAVSRRSFGSGESREQLASFTSQIITFSNVSNDLKQKAFNLTVSEMKKQINQSPNDIRYLVFLANVYNRAQQYGEAIGILEKAIELSPQKQQLYFELGTSYLNKAEYEKGFEILKKAFELDPSFEEARRIYALAAIFYGKNDLAEELMKDYGGTIIPDERFIQAYNASKQFDKVVAIWELFVAKSPNNPQYRISLAAGYLQLGEREKAIEQLEKAIELEPRFREQGEYYIKEIRAGRNP